jgi:hypothetical protein
MNIDDAFLSPFADDLFSAVAAFGDAQALQTFDVADDVADFQKPARQAIERAVSNALNPRNYNPGSRIALIKGDAGSGKSHVLTTTFKRAASTQEVYPAVLQLTAPVSCEEYDTWLLDAIIRQLSARHFPDDSNHSPLRRLAERLLDRVELAEKDEFLRVIEVLDTDDEEDLDTDDEIVMSLRLAKRIHHEAQARLVEEPPSPDFIAAVILAGFGRSSALNFLRYGKVGRRIETLELYELTTPYQRIEVLKNLGLTAQIVGAGIMLGFDQVENAIRLGSEGLFIHALTQAVRLAESVINCAIVFVTLANAYEAIAGPGGTRELTVADRDRIEREPPVAVRLTDGTLDFVRAVIVKRLAVLRERAQLPPVPGSLDPLPEWFLSRIAGIRNVRTALENVAEFRQRAVELGRLPGPDDYVEKKEVRPPGPAPQLEFEKEWADFQDLAPVVTSRLLDRTKGELIAWWVEQASLEHTSGTLAEATLRFLSDAPKTPVLDIAIKENDMTIERRELAICEAPNRNHQLAKQVENFLDDATGVPAVLRTNGFPKGRQTQVAPALRKLETLSGLKLDLNETEWHILHRAREFYEKWERSSGFLAWRRDQQWLNQLIAPLQPLIAAISVVGDDETGPQTTAPTRGPDMRDQPTGREGDGVTGGEPCSDSFPVHIGVSFEGVGVEWDPYRGAPNHLNNFSVLVTGDAGSGKTQTIRVLIEAACRKGLALTIFDFKADYCVADFAHPLGIDVIDVRRHGLPFNPLQPPRRGASGVQPIEHAYEIASILKRVFGLGAVQEGLLRGAITRAYKNAGIEACEWIDPTATSWPTFDLVLEQLRHDRGTAPLVTKLSPLSELGLFGAGSNPRTSLGDFLNTRVCLKLNDLPSDEIKSAVAEVLIVQLHGYALRGDQPRRLTRMMVFDEAHRVKDSKRLESLAREGRAFGVGIVIGTQFPDDIPETMAGNLATQLFLMNNQAAHRRFVVTQVFGTTSTVEAKALLDQLTHLKPLEGLFINTHHNGILVRVKPHHARPRCNLPPPALGQPNAGRPVGDVHNVLPGQQEHRAPSTKLPTDASG